MARFATLAKARKLHFRYRANGRKLSRSGLSHPRITLRLLRISRNRLAPPAERALCF